MSASLRRAGRKPAARAFEAIALANDLPLYTANPADFEGIEGLEIVALPARG